MTNEDDALTRADVLEYVADMARQLADMCRPHARGVTACLDLAEFVAREELAGATTRKPN